MPAADRCRPTDGCITCGDVAVVLTVIDVVDAAGGDARCRDDAGRSELVATDLVGAVTIGDRLLVHAGVAIGRLDAEPEEPNQEESRAVRRRVP